MILSEQESMRPAKKAPSKNALVLGLTVGACALALALAGPALAKQHKKKQVKPAHVEVISKDGPVAALPPPIPACSNASARALDKVYGIKGWDIPYPSYGDTLLGDYGCWRTKLAELGFGILTFQVNQGNTALLKHPYPVSNGPGRGSNQAYFGQRPSAVTDTQTYLTYDLSRWGVPDGQLQIAGGILATTDINYAPNTFNIVRLAWYQTLFNKQVEINVGWNTNQSDFIGAYINGNIANPFGNSSGIPFITGMSVSPVAAPMAKATWHITDHFYDEFAVQRSLVPGLNTLQAEHYLNPTGLEFSPSGSIFGNKQNTPSALLINELGYRNHATLDESTTWIRFGQLYNFSDVYNYKTQGQPTSPYAGGGTSRIYSFYALGDRQILKFDNSSPYTAYRGLYVGASVYYAPPETSPVTQTYDARIYVVGPFAWRPVDLFVLTYEHNVASSYLANDTNNFQLVPGVPAFGTLCSAKIVCARHANNNVGATYTAKLTDGIYSTIGLSYTDNPAYTYTPYPSTGWVKNDLALVGAIFLVF
jgi:porin